MGLGAVLLVGNAAAPARTRSAVLDSTIAAFILPPLVDGSCNNSSSSSSSSRAQPTLSWFSTSGASRGRFARLPLLLLLLLLLREHAHEDSVLRLGDYSIRFGVGDARSQGDATMPRDVIDEKDLEVKLATLRGSRDPVFILFTSTRTGEGGGGERWCPDCTAADPVIEEAFEAAPASATLVEVRVERSRWKVEPGQKHPWRKEPFFVKGVPTLVVWDAANDKVVRRVYDCEQLEMLRDVFTAGTGGPPSL